MCARGMSSTRALVIIIIHRSIIIFRIISSGEYWCTAIMLACLSNAISLEWVWFLNALLVPRGLGQGYPGPGMHGVCGLWGDHWISLCTDILQELEKFQQVKRKKISIKRDLNPLHSVPHTRAPTTTPPLLSLLQSLFPPFIDKS